MQEWVQKLLAVQELDLRLDKLREQLKSVPEEQAKVARMLGADEAVLTQAKDGLKTIEKELKQFELEADGLRAKKADFLTKSAMIKSNEEYRAALHQVEQCDKHIADIEDRELAVMGRLEAARATVAAAAKRLEATKQRAKEMSADLDTRLGNSKAQIAKLEAERLPTLVGIDPGTIRRYERLRASPARINHPDHRALVPVRDGVCCDRCRMNLTAQTRMNTRKGMPVPCENCGTMLFHEG
jgi:predicted  nucleic acid-binding Zn-ribbon protein